MATREEKAGSRVVTALACLLALAMPCTAFAATGTGGADKAETAGSAKVQAASSETGAATAVKGDEAGATASDIEAEAQVEDEVEIGPSDELLAWAQDKDCGVCHEVQEKSVEDEACGASLHSALKLACTDCHADDALIEIHDAAKPDAKAPTKLKKSELNVALCTTCHAPETLAEATADSKALTDSEGTVVNPHEIPEVKEHKDISCESCHKMHSESKPASKAPTLCEDCHHEDVYECYTCHS